MDVALNNLQRLICHKTQPTNQPTNETSEDEIFEKYVECLYLPPQAGYDTRSIFKQISPTLN